MKIRKAFLFFLLDVFFKEEAAMLVRLYASEIILEKITIDDVPNKLKDKVRKYLEDMGYKIKINLKGASINLLTFIFLRIK